MTELETLLQDRDDRVQHLAQRLQSLLETVKKGEITVDEFEELYNDLHKVRTLLESSISLEHKMMFNGVLSTIVDVAIETIYIGI